VMCNTCYYNVSAIHVLCHGNRDGSIRLPLEPAVPRDAMITIMTRNTTRSPTGLTVVPLIHCYAHVGEEDARGDADRFICERALGIIRVPHTTGAVPVTFNVPLTVGYAHTGLQPELLQYDDIKEWAKAALEARNGFDYNL
jgi:hypothetical protein